MRFCSRCGRGVGDDASFCPNCGAPLTRRPVQSAMLMQPATSSPQLTSVSTSGYFSKPFIYCMIVSAVMIFSVLIIGAGRGSQSALGQAIQTQNSIEVEAGATTALSIFFNNVQIALLSFIPILGSLWMLLVQYNTGYAFGNLARAYGVDFILTISSSVATPDGLLEYSAYIFALGESLMLIHSALEKRASERLIKHTWRTLLIVVGVLLIAAILEASSIGRPMI